MTLKSPELLLPAGSLDKMRAAYDFGADAIYAGQPRYSLRARNNEFRQEQIEQGILEAHARGKKFFLTSNLLPHNDKVRTYLRDIEPIIAMGPDALIMADPGLIMMVREKWPQVPIHLSVQANTVNFMAVKFWQKVGVTRIILSRELSLDEIEKIRQECPDMELEVFVHGALCIAYSGRCLLSGYFNRRDPNQGTCTNACRWEYKTHEGVQASDTGEVIPIQLEGDFNFAQEQESAEKAFSACGNGERHPAADQVYRRAIDDAVAGRPFNPDLLLQLEGMANRGYTGGLLERRPAQDYQNYITGHSQFQRSQFVGEVQGIEGGWAEVIVKNRFDVGDTLEVIHPSGNVEIVLAEMRNLDGEPITAAPGSPLHVRVPLDARFAGALLARRLQAA